MKCPYCHEEAAEGDLFCGNCGRSLEGFSGEPAKPRGPDKPASRSLQIFLTVSLLVLTSTLALMLCVAVPRLWKEQSSVQESETASAKTTLQDSEAVSEEASVSQTEAVTEETGTVTEETTQTETVTVTEETTQVETETVTEETTEQADPNTVILDGSFFADGQQRESATGYILPESESVYLTESDVSYLSLKGLCYAKNEIFARHHRKFSSAELNTWFTGLAWYSGEIEPADFTDSVVDSTFNEYEKKNMYLLSSMETSRGLYQLDQ